MDEKGLSHLPNAKHPDATLETQQAKHHSPLEDATEPPHDNLKIPTLE